MADKDQKMDLSSFKEKLDEAHDWPCRYMFKFIVPCDCAKSFVSDIFGAVQTDVTERASKTGKYISLSVELEAHSSDEVLAFYEKAATVPGVICL